MLRSKIDITITSKESKAISISSESSNSITSESQQVSVAEEEAEVHRQPFTVYSLVAHPLFNFTIVVLIIANIVVLACDKVDLTAKEIKTL